MALDLANAKRLAQMARRADFWMAIAAARAFVNRCCAKNLRAQLCSSNAVLRVLMKRRCSDIARQFF